MKLENLKRKNNMNYDKRLEIRLSDRLKTIIKYYYKENYSSIIRELIIMHFESISSVLDSEISDFYETLKPLTPEYFNYAKTKGFDTFSEKFKKNKDLKKQNKELKDEIRKLKNSK